MSFLYSEQEVWGISNFDSLLDMVSNGRDIDVFLKTRRDVHMAALNLDSDYASINQSVKDYKNTIHQNQESLSELNKLEKLLNEYTKEKQELSAEFKEIQHLYSNIRVDVILKNLLDEYDGDFNKKDLQTLRSNPDKVKRIFYSKKIKSFQSKLESFVDKYQTKELYNLVKKYFPYNVSTGFTNYSSELERQKSVKSRWIEQDSESLSRAISAKSDKEQEWKQKIETEAKTIRAFAGKLSDDICNPKDLKVSEWVERLADMDDDELVMFDISTGAGYTDYSDKDARKRLAVNNIMKYNCLSKGPETEKWFVDQGHDTVFSAVELFSPIMRVRDAKKIIPKLCRNLTEAGVAGNLVVAMRPNELLHNCPEKKEYEVDSAINTIMDAMKNKEVPWYSTKTRHLGFEKYPDDEYLFSGSMVSDDYKFLSRRQGRCGISFATQDFNYAFSYAALTSILSNPSDKDMMVEERQSATLDWYPERYKTSWNGKRVYVGFVNVYERNSKDRFYPNFGLEHGLANKDGIKHGFDNTREIETFVTPEKNPVIDKLLCVVWNKQGFILPMRGQGYPDNVKAALQTLSDRYAGGMEDTLPYLDFGKRLERFQKQKKEFESGVVHENDTLARQKERREKLMRLIQKPNNGIGLVQNVGENAM